MLLLAWTNLRDRRQVFAGALATVCLGVALVQSSLLALVAAATTRVPSGLPEAEHRALSEGYEAAVSLLGLVVALAVFVAVFIVGSTFAFSVAQRRRELALLRLTGAGRGQLRRLLAGEGLLVGLAGSALGAAAGVPVMRLQVWMLDRFGFVPPGFEVPWRSWVIGMSPAAGVTIALVGVLAASRRASRVRPLEALRDTGRAARVMTAPRWVAGVVFLGGGIALILTVPGIPAEAAVPLSMLVAITLVVGFSALAPLLVPLVGGLFGVVSRGPLGELAHANLRDDARRSASIAAPIMLLFALVASLAGTLGTVGEAERREILGTVDADLLLTAQDSAASAIAGVEGVELVSEEVTVAFDLRRVEGDGAVRYEHTHGVAAEAAAFTATRDVAATHGDLDDLHGQSIAVSPSADPERRWRVGDTLHVRMDGRERELRIAALLPETIAGPFYVLPADLAPPDTGPRVHLVSLEQGADAEAAAARLAGWGDVATPAQWVEDRAADDERVTRDVLAALLGLTALYTVIAMVNAVVISASNRRAEFAAARVAGLTRGQVVGVALRESQAAVLIGVLLGGLAATGTILGVALAVRDLIGVAVVSVPWPLPAALALGAAVVVGAAAVATALAATRTPPVRLVSARE